MQSFLRTSGPRATSTEDLVIITDIIFNWRDFRPKRFCETHLIVLQSEWFFSSVRLL